MVSKVAVIALVAIVACPILLGYALNLSEVTETGYKLSDDTLNVTPLLQDGYDYSYAAANITDLNSRFYQAGSPTTPDYTVSTTKSAIQVSKNTLAAGAVPIYTDNPKANALYYNTIFNYNPAVGYVTLNITFDDNTTGSVIGLHSVYWDLDNAVLYITKYNYSGGIWSDATVFGIFSNIKTISYSKTSGYNGTGEQFIYWDFGPPSTYVNMAAGYVLNKYANAIAAGTTEVDLPWHTNNLLVSFDLNSITASSYSFKMKTGDAYHPLYYMFEKTTVSSVVHWKVKLSSTENGTYNELTELYYDPSKSSNTYQVFMDLNKTSFRYVGSWPTLIGEANSYWEYEHNHNSSLDEVFLTLIGVTPKMRIDAADYRAFQYPVIENETYAPSQFRSNPATTINNPIIYGTSISFGGNTYTVSKGNITLGSHQIPVKGLVLSSVPVAGGYENRIGNTVVSTTANPSTITFNGKWSADITTVSMESYTYTRTDWTPGEFGWDGIDQNFLMVGLLTSLGAFIALGIYIRRTKANLWPLLLVCGGAAMLFFCML